MREHQRQSLVKAVAALIDSGHATFWELEHQRTLYGATRPELAELLHDLDTRVATEYETGPRLMRGSFMSGEDT